MNSYTLKFLDQSYDEKFTQETISQVRNNLLRMFALIIIIMSGFNIIHDLAMQQSQKLYLIIICAFNFFALIQTFIFRLNNQIMLIGCNMSFMITQFIGEDCEYSYSIYIRGGNVMLAHCTIIAVCDFPQSVLQIAILFIFRIVSTALLQTLEIDVIIGSVLMSSLFIYITYQVVKNTRLQFLYRLSKTKWDQLLLKIIDKKFIYFVFNVANFSFQLKQSNYIYDTPDLLKEIRQFQIHNIPMETFMFKHLPQLNENIQTFSFTIQNGKIKNRITLFKIMLEEPSFIIIFDDQQEKRNQLLKEKSHLKLETQHVLNKILQMNLKLLNIGISCHKPWVLLKLRFILFKVLLKQTQKKLEPLNLTTCLKKLEKILFFKSKSLKIEDKDNEIIIVTYKNRLIEMIVDICNQLHSHQILINYSLKSNRSVQLQFIGHFQSHRNFNIKSYEDIYEDYSIIDQPNLMKIIIIELKADHAYQII